MSVDHNAFVELLYFEEDGALGPAERAGLGRHLDGCTECRAERRRLERLRELIHETNIAVRPGFSARVLAALPAAGWESRHPRSWVAAAALLLILLGAATAAMLVGGETGGESLPAVGALAAIADLFRTAILAGAGLLAASWQGLGVALRDAFGGAAAPLVALGVLVVGLDVLFVRMLLRARRRREAPAEVRAARSREAKS